MTIEKHRKKTSLAVESGKGKYATSTENRRLMWEHIIWPLILQINRNYFTPQEYHKRRDEVSKQKGIPNFKNDWRHGISLGQGYSFTRREILFDSLQINSLYEKKGSLGLRNCSQGNKIKKMNHQFLRIYPVLVIGRYIL